MRNRAVTVLRVESHDFEHGFSIGLTLAAEPYSVTNCIRLTKKEAECVAKYDECLLKFLDFNYGKEWVNQVLRAASDLSRLKHNIRLVSTIYKVFKFEDAMDPEFFENSGFYDGGIDFDMGRLLEKSIIS